MKLGLWGWVFGIILLLASLFLIIVVVLQESKTNMSGAVTGGESNYASKGKTMTKDIFLSKLTKYVALIFFAITLLAYLLYPVLK